MLSSYSDLGNSPVFSGARARNTMLDWFFYDVDGLTPEERAELVNQRNVEGSILIVWPKAAIGPVSYQKFESYDALRASPGALVTRFTIAGVGSSDVGAAAFARTVADHFDCPVGAIVAGYGVADLLSEAMGGWFVLGGANRVLQLYSEAMEGQGVRAKPDLRNSGNMAPDALNSVDHREDSAALVSLMMDRDRKVESVFGHSKGCLSIAYALDALTDSGKSDVIARQKDMQIVTAGTVVRTPEVFTNVAQYLGELDWFGGMNSRLSLEYTTVPGTWHHLNTSLPGHLNFAQTLSGQIET